MKTATGVCKYCGQSVALEVPESFTQDIIDEEAVKRCDCPEAKAYTKQQETIASAEGMIKDFFSDREGMQAVKDLLLSAVKPLAENAIGSISISKDGVIRAGTEKPSRHPGERD